MNKEKNIIIIGVLATILTLVIAGFIFYLIYNNSKPSNEESNSNLSENIDTSTNTNNNTINNENDNNVSNPNSDNVNTPTSNNDAEKTVTVYLFRGKGCPHCEHAKEFLESIASEYDYLQIISYEVLNNMEHQKLMEEV